MFSASSLTRLAGIACLPNLVRSASCLLGCAVAVLFAATAPAQTIDLSLNVFYSDPSDVFSGGTWQLVAKSSADNFGIVGLAVNLTNINDDDVVNEGPRGLVQTNKPAGFASLFEVFPNTNYDMLFTAQEPLPSGQQGAFYGVGRLQNGSPIYPGQQGGTNSVAGSPNITTLTAVEDIPWATGDALGNSAWNIAAVFASGTFEEDVTPGFFPTGQTGSVFTSIGSATVFGTTTEATITTIVRTNSTGPSSADYNNDGFVDAADYVLWRKVPGSFGGIPGGYNLWRQQFGTDVGPGAGGGGASGAVPEPASVILLVFGLASVYFMRRRG
jgi:hypothetical protein